MCAGEGLGRNGEGDWDWDGIVKTVLTRQTGNPSLGQGLEIGPMEWIYS